VRDSDIFKGNQVVSLALNLKLTTHPPTNLPVLSMERAGTLSCNPWIIKQAHSPLPEDYARLVICITVFLHFKIMLVEYILKGQFHEIWGIFNGYTYEEHSFEIHH
jgi:hypothetical protein